MTGLFFSLNGVLVPVNEAKVAWDDIEVTYGYGVYETLKVRKGRVYFPEMHEERLFHSAKLVDVDHPWKNGDVQQYLENLILANQAMDANLKVLLYGGCTQETARLVIIQLAPLFPDRKLYRDGAAAITWEGERWLPRAKSLNMLQSSMAFNAAQKAGAYDALFVNRNSEITEGTRTNFWFTDNQKLYTPPEEEVLEGVTQLTVITCAREAGIEVVRKPFPLKAAGDWDGLFLTSTSTKIMPLKAVDTRVFEIPQLVLKMEKLYDEWLKNWTDKTYHI